MTSPLTQLHVCSLKRSGLEHHAAGNRAVPLHYLDATVGSFGNSENEDIPQRLGFFLEIPLTSSIPLDPSASRSPWNPRLAELEWKAQSIEG
jgi:hypothetical protein